MHSHPGTSCLFTQILPPWPRAATTSSKTGPSGDQRNFLGAHALPPEYKGRTDDYVDLVINTMLPRIKSQGIACTVDVFCESIGFSIEQTKRLFTAATDLDLPVKRHAEQLSDSGGSTLAAQFNALSCDHLEYLSLTTQRPWPMQV